MLVDLDPGEYNLKGRRNGYLDSFYGARRTESKGTPIALGPGVEMKDIRLKLVPFAVLDGTVRETDGEPFAGDRVDVFAVTRQALPKTSNSPATSRWWHCWRPSMIQTARSSRT